MLPEIVKALETYGPWGVGAIAILDSAGIPLPAGVDILLLSIAWKAPDSAYLAAILATIGSLGGNLALFLAARGGGRRWVKATSDPDKPRRFRVWFKRYGLVTVFIPATFPFIPLPLKVFVISAGVFHTRPIRFIAVITFSRIVRYFGLAYLGILLGEHAGAFLQHNALAIAAAALATALGLFLIVKWTGSREGDATIS